MIAWIDAHNHLQDLRMEASPAVCAQLRASGVLRCIVNATCEADWNPISNLANQNDGLVVPAFGIHPWFAHEASENWQMRLREMLTNHPRASIGECGLDSWKSTPPMEIQREVFLAHLAISTELNRPVTIHCLKAWGVLMECFGELPPTSNFLMHSFSGSLEIARRLLEFGAYFSISGYFLHPRKSAALELFRQLPRDRILMESDAPDMMPPPEIVEHGLASGGNHPANLPSIGRAVAKSLGIREEEFAASCNANAERCFGLGLGPALASPQDST